MIATTARVISADNGTALVEPTMESGCGGCKASSSCAVSGLGKYFSNNRQAIAVRCDASVHAGDQLHMTMNEGDFIKAGMLVYLLPSVFIIIGAGCAASLDFGDAGALAGAVLGFVGGLLIVRLIGWTPNMTVRKQKNLFNEGDTP
ncbi:MAG: SoxR reducing system RseC family protein [Nitrosomonadales bacterium]|nr:SoxR reducing system RseC family protein [Nitrosomonadales bacterium]